MLSAILLAALWVVVDQTIRETIDASVREAVDRDLAGLADIHASGGSDELVRRIGDRLVITPTDGSRPHYLLADKAGRMLTGDIAKWPALDPVISESGTILIGQQTKAFARTTLLPEGLRLLVAHEPATKAPLLGRIALVFLLAGSVFVFCIALFARAAGDGIRRRVAKVNQAFGDGDELALTGLVAPHRPDEIDQIASQAAEAVKRARHLTAAYRETSEQVAHEIRTPLTHLDARLVRALEQDCDAGITAHLIDARSDIRRLVATLESLLDIAANKAREGDIQGLKPMDLSAMVQSICDLYQSSAEDADYKFGWSIAPAIVMNGDEAQFSRLVTNLLDNAFKYNCSGGSIWLELADGPTLTISDDGPGIPEHDRSRVFERFYRSPATSADQAGSGLGLALAQAIAQRHGLTIRLAPSAVGACFVVGREV